MSTKKKKSKKHTPAPAAKPVTPALDRDAVTDAVRCVGKLVDQYARPTDKDDLNEKLKEVQRALLSESDKKTLRQFQYKIASALRDLPSALRPNFERVRFYLWVVDTVAGAREVLPLLDDVEWCPDKYMQYIKEHYRDSSFGYKTFSP